LSRSCTRYLIRSGAVGLAAIMAAKIAGAANIVAVDIHDNRLETGSVGVNADVSFHGPGILDNVASELNARPRKRVEGDHRKFVVLFSQHGTDEADQGGVADREDTTKTTGPLGHRQSRTSSRHGQHQ
jgi:threonine dehydrogenase-like Zn-dependent dehydrogenase